MTLRCVMYAADRSVQTVGKSRSFASLRMTMLGDNNLRGDDNLEGDDNLVSGSQFDGGWQLEAGVEL